VLLNRLSYRIKVTNTDKSLATECCSSRTMSTGVYKSLWYINHEMCLANIFEIRPASRHSIHDPAITCHVRPMRLISAQKLYVFRCLEKHQLFVHELSHPHFSSSLKWHNDMLPVSAVLTTGQMGHWPGAPSSGGPQPRNVRDCFYHVVMLLSILHVILVSSLIKICYLDNISLLFLNHASTIFVT